MSDYYKILGVNKNSSDEEIKKAYRKLALKHHPDKNRDGNNEQFQKIQEAYETLSDPEKKQNYDNPRHNLDNMFPFENHPFFRHHNNQNHNNRKQKKNDHVYVCKISLKDVYFGTTKKFKVNRSKICRRCNKMCNQCNGNGIITQYIQMGPFTQSIQQKCQQCNGDGKYKLENTNCEECKQDGYINEEKIFEVNIPRGVESGKQIVFEEWGEQANKDNEISGNLLVNIIVDDNPHFRRNGYNLIYTTQITLKESIIGKKIKVPYFEDDIIIDTKGFGIINPNKEYIVFDKGLFIQDSNKKGELRIIFKISYPDKSYNDDEINILANVFKQVNL